MTELNISGVTTEPIAAVPPKATPVASTNTPQGDSAPGSPPAGYSSPTMALDGMTGTLIIEYRSATSGEEVSQTPSRAALEYEQSQRLAADKSVAVKDGGADKASPAS